MKIELKDGENIESAVEEVNRTILEAYHTNCQEKSRKQISHPVWWNKRLQQLDNTVRKLCTKPNSTTIGISTEYNEETQKTKRNCNRKYCGRKTQQMATQSNKNEPEIGKTRYHTKKEQQFQPSDLPDMNGIHPIFVQRGKERITLHLYRIFSVCLAWGIIPAQCHRARLTYLPKVDTISDRTPESYTPITTNKYRSGMVRFKNRTRSSTFHTVFQAEKSAIIYCKRK